MLTGLTTERFWTSANVMFFKCDENLLHGVGATKSGVQATIHVPWMTEHPARAMGIPIPPVKVPNSRQPAARFWRESE
jgi:hypothetical protein